MESVIESPLDVLSRAATMVQRDSPMHGDSVSGARNGSAPSSSTPPPSSSSSPPSASSGPPHLRKWRKERRCVAAASAKATAGVEARLPSAGSTAAAAAKLFLLVPLSVRGSAGVPSAAASTAAPLAAPNCGVSGVKSLVEATSRGPGTLLKIENRGELVTSEDDTPEDSKNYDGRGKDVVGESPLDMTQPRDGRTASECSSSPPPQYQRPSVITCVPAVGRLNVSPSPSFSSSPPSSAPISPQPSSVIPGQLKSDDSDEESSKPGQRREMNSGDSCDPVIDEHFRRSLGSDYANLFSPKGLSSSTTGSATAPGTGGKGDTGNSVTITGMSVDDHFAKALGETWLKLQAAEMTKERKSGNSTDGEPSSPSKCAVSSQQQRRGLVWCPPIEGSRQPPSSANPRDGTWQHCGKRQPCGKLLH